MVNPSKKAGSTKQGKPASEKTTSQKAAKGDPGSAAKKARYRDDELVIIKPYKGRAKYELYVHAASLRDFLQSQPLLIPSEGFDGTVSLQKKLLFKDAAYGQMVQAVVTWFDKQRRFKDAAAIQQSLSERVQMITNEFRLQDDTVRTATDFTHRLQQAYKRLLSELTP